MNWPVKYPVCDVGISVTTYEESLDIVLRCAREREKALVAHMPVHGIYEAQRNAPFHNVINAFDIVTPDGQPVRWVLDFLYNTGLPSRVAGPDFMFQLCEVAAENNISIFLLGGTPQVGQKLQSRLLEMFPAISIAGVYSPPFGEMTDEENRKIVDLINTSGTHIVFIGLGCPKQELFAYANRDAIKAVQICAGAAFDLLAGDRKRAPQCMQRCGLEWLFRFCQEPGRLWKRYLFANSFFIYKTIQHSMAAFWINGNKPSLK